MGRAAFVTGALGLGCAIVFALAALVSGLFPNGTMVQSGWGGVSGAKDFVAVPAVEPPVVVTEK
jgi:hypothetical protein